MESLPLCPIYSGFRWNDTFVSGMPRVPCVNSSVFSMEQLEDKNILRQWGLTGGSCVTEDMLLKGAWDTHLLICLVCFPTFLCSASSSAMNSHHIALPSCRPKNNGPTDNVLQSLFELIISCSFLAVVISWHSYLPSTTFWSTFFL